MLFFVGKTASNNSFGAIDYLTCGKESFMKKHSIRQAISLLLCFVMLSSVVFTSCDKGGGTSVDTSGKPTEYNEDRL